MASVQHPARVFFRHCLLLVLVLLTIYPFFYMLVTSLKSDGQIIENFWAIFPEPRHWENYTVAWDRVHPYLFNSAKISILAALGTLLAASTSAFVFARYHFRGKEVLFLSIMAVMMVPGVLTLIPSFIVVRNLQLLNTHWAAILPYIAGGQVFAIFILRSFFENIPSDYFEAARIDGASEFQSYYRIALPLSKPILGTVAIMSIMGSWNDYVWPTIVLTREDLRTITVGLSYFRHDFDTEVGHLMAGNVIASIPIVILFLFTMRLFIAGLTTGGIKA